MGAGVVGSKKGMSTNLLALSFVPPSPHSLETAFLRLFPLSQRERGDGEAGGVREYKPQQIHLSPSITPKT